MPVLSVRLKLRAREGARLEGDRLARLEAAAAVAEEEKKKQATTLSYLKPLNKRVREKTLAEPPPRLLLLRKAKATAYNTAKRTDSAGGGRSASRGRRTTPRGLLSTSNIRVARGHSTGSEGVPGYMRRTNRRAQGRIKSSGQSGALGHLKNSDDILWGTGKSVDQKRTARGRSGPGSRRGATRVRRGHASKNRGGGGQHSIKKSAKRISRPSSPTWPAMSTIVQAVARPSRLKLRGNR